MQLHFTYIDVDCVFIKLIIWKLCFLKGQRGILQVDSLLGARGGSHEHEATRRMRNEFMAAWDGLRSKENQRILVLGATNRPFDLDDAVIRRLPRR